VVFSKAVDQTLKETCLEIEKRFEIHFLEICTDKDHVHFLVQTVPRMCVTQIITILKSFTTREIFEKHSEVKKQLWGGEFWTDGYFVNTVSKFGDEKSISKYVRKLGREKEYTVLHSSKQLEMF
jgi:REP element-mobilizing transposase RayT